MTSFLTSVVVLVVVATSINYCVVHAAVPLEFAAHIKTCAQNHNTNQQDMVNSLMNPGTYPDFSCAWACVFKNLELLDSHGMYNVEAAILNIKKLSKGVEVKSAVESVKKCAYVNNEPVSDGWKGCDRSRLLVKCLVKDILPKS